MLHEFACHPCAGAMLIFSVSFQFQYMCCRSEHYLNFSMLSLKPALSFSFHLHQEAIQFLLAFGIRVVLSAYLRLLIFLPIILIAAWLHPSQHMLYSFHMMDEVCCLTQGLNLCLILLHWQAGSLLLAPPMCIYICIQ